MVAPIFGELNPDLSTSAAPAGTTVCGNIVRRSRMATLSIAGSRAAFSRMFTGANRCLVSRPARPSCLPVTIARTVP
jgi:hypothetical protein